MSEIAKRLNGFMEGTAKLDYQVRYEATVKDLQDKLALAQLENVKLREALEIARDYQFDAVNQFHSDFAGYKAEKHKQYDEDLKLVEQALSTTTTHAELESFVAKAVDAKFGEPVAYANLNAKDTLSMLHWTKNQWYRTPLYAKKG